MTEFPPRRIPYVVVGGMLALMLVASVVFGALHGGPAGLIAAAVFAAALVPTVRRAFDRGPALTLDERGVDARAAGVQLDWSDVTGIRHKALPTPGTGGRGFLVLALAQQASEPRRSSPIAPRPRDADDGGRELWIALTGIDATPAEVLAAAKAARAR